MFGFCSFQKGSLGARLGLDLVHSPFGLLLSHHECLISTPREGSTRKRFCTDHNLQNCQRPVGSCFNSQNGVLKKAFIVARSFDVSCLHSHRSTVTVPPKTSGLLRPVGLSGSYPSLRCPTFSLATCAKTGLSAAPWFHELKLHRLPAAHWAHWLHTIQLDNPSASPV